MLIPVDVQPKKSNPRDEMQRSAFNRAAFGALLRGMVKRKASREQKAKAAG